MMPTSFLHYLHLAIPIIDLEQFRDHEHWEDIKRVLSPRSEQGEMSPEQWSATIDEILAYAQELDGQDNPEPLEGEAAEDAASEGDEGQLDTKGLFGENGEGKAWLLQAKDGQKLIYKGFVQDSNGQAVEAQGVLDVKGFDDGESPFSSATQASFSYNADTHHLTTTLKDDNNYVFLNQDLGDAAPFITQTTETIDGREVKVIDIKVQSFIAGELAYADFYGILDFFGQLRIFKGDNHNISENGTYRTHQLISLYIQNGKIIDVQMNKDTGLTVELSKDKNCIGFAKAKGDSIESLINRVYDSKLNQLLTTVRMKADESNPLVSGSPGITYDFVVIFDEDFYLREIKIETDKFPSYAFFINDILIHHFDQGEYTPWRLFAPFLNHEFHQYYNKPKLNSN